MINKKLVFDHRGRTKADKEGPVEIRITYNGKPYYINTGVKCLSSQFANERIVRHRDARALNERLAEVALKIELAVNECIKQGKTIDVAEIKRQAYNIENGGGKKETAMIDWLDAQVPELPISDGTRRRYTVLMNRLREYDGLKAWSDLSVENLYRFDAWLHRIPKPQSNGDRQARRERQVIGDSAVYNYHRTLRSLLTRAVKFGIIESNPYDRVKGEFRKGIKENVEYLTEAEIAAVESLHPMPGTQMAMARDLFVFQLYTGLSYADSQVFSINDYKEVDGRWVCVGERVKTGVAYVSQLLPQAVDVLRRYNMQVPKVGNVQYNLSLKIIQQALGIRTRLHSHLARHTFATRALAMGAKIENVSAMLGHTNITQTQRYAKVLAKSVHDDFAMLEKKLSDR